MSQGINESLDNSDTNSFSVREQIEQYLIHWKWFLLSAVVALLLTYVKLNFSRTAYEAVGKIKIENEKNNGQSKLSAFNELSTMGLMSGSQDHIEDEIEVLKSKTIISETIKSLELNIQFLSNKGSLSKFFDNTLGLRTNFFKDEQYEKPPLKINFLSNDSIIYAASGSFIVIPTSENTFIYEDAVSEDRKIQSFGQKFSSILGEVIITPNIDLKDKLQNGIQVKVVPLSDLTNYYAEIIKVEPVSEFSSVVQLNVVDATRIKAEDFLNELIIQYNNRAIFLKEELAESTAKFVGNRLEIISEELEGVDLNAESIKTRYGISDAASSAGLNLQAGKEIENRIVQTSTQLETTKAIKEFVTAKERNDLLPADIGVTDNTVSNSMSKYNELMLEKKRLLKTSTEKNPTVVYLDEQLRDLKNNISQGLNNLESTQQISLDALNRQDRIINSRIYSAPKQERQIRDIQRQQGIKEQLYLYLLQKREETAITLGVADPNAKIIDYPEGLPDRVAPKKKSSYAISLILGLLIPFITIFVIDLLDSKIHTKEDVSRVLNIPIIGDIPKVENVKRFLIKKDDYSPIAEAFRILRTNLNFILPHKQDGKGSTIFVTSSIAHEGKSLVSTNLATSLAQAGKKTIILGMDIRAPGIKPYLNIRGKIGVTNYTIDRKLKPEDLIVEVPKIENLHLISSGDLAPNPAELLMSDRIKDLFEFAKENYEYVIVDTAAFTMVTDTLLLSKFADAFIFTVRANFLDKRMLGYIKSIYNEKRISNMVILLNGVDIKKSYGYGYGYGYGTKFEAANRPWWKLKLWS